MANGNGTGNGSVQAMYGEAAAMRHANELATRMDEWESVITGLGRSRDKRVGARLATAAPITNREELQNLFVGDDIAATLAELPAGEMVREWFDLKIDDAKDVDETVRGPELQTLEQRISLPKQMEQKQQELGAKAHFFHGIVMGRVFGGSLMFMGVDDGGTGVESMREPLDEGNIKSFNFLRVFDRFDVDVAEADGNPASPTFGEPSLYRLRPQVTHRGVFGNTAPSSEILVHASRFIRFDGVQTTRDRMIRNSGWADSVYTRTMQVIRDYNMAWAGISHLITDFSQAVFKMRGLMEALKAGEGDLVVQRLINMDMCRSVARAVPIDADGEGFSREQTPVSGLPELMDRFGLRLATAARMPVSLLLGQSPSGLQATGDADISFFYDQISAKQETELRPKIERFLRLLFLDKSGPTQGQEPENWSFTFNPLWQLDAKEEADLRKTQAETDEVYLQNGVVTTAEIAASRFGGDTYSPDTTLDSQTRAAQAAAGVAGEPRQDKNDLRVHQITIKADSPQEFFDRLGRLNKGGAVRRMDQDDVAVCDPSSPDYDPEKCRALQTRGDSRGLVTTFDEGHGHFANVDLNGNGATGFARDDDGIDHDHVIRNWEVVEAAGHTHTIEKPDDL
jgi:phage-related protein (TIGR01555 family)